MRLKANVFLVINFTKLFFRRDARVVEWDGLENRCAGNCTEGSNPSLSASSVFREKILNPKFYSYHQNSNAATS